MVEIFSAPVDALVGVNTGSCQRRTACPIRARRGIVICHDLNSTHVIAKLILTTLSYCVPHVWPLATRSQGTEQLHVMASNKSSSSSCVAEQHNQEGSQAFKSADYDAAYRCYSRAIKADPTAPKYWTDRANTLFW